MRPGGWKHDQETKNKISESMSGVKKTDSHIKNMKKSLKGRTAWNKGMAKKSFCSDCGKQLADPYRPELCKSCSHKGERCYRWDGGITPINKAIRNSVEYRLWRESVFERDDYTCIWCGQKGGSLEADHIKPFCDYPELRFAIDNGRTLCVDCHRTTDTYGVKGGC